MKFESWDSTPVYQVTEDGVANYEVWYRLRDFQVGYAVAVEAEKFYVVKETPCGAWVASEYSPIFWGHYTLRELKAGRHLNWVNKNTVRRLCYPTLQEAIESFKARKLRQQRIIKNQLEQVEKVIESFHKLEGVTEDDLASGVIELSRGVEEFVFFSERRKPIDW